MANYNIDIGVVIKGNEKLTKFNESLKKTTVQVKQLNDFLKVFQQSGNGLVRSFNSLNSVLATTKANFNEVASGTRLQEKAARQLILAEKELNREYQQRDALLQRLRGTGPLPLPGTGIGRDPIESSRRRKQRRLSQTLKGQSVPLTSPIFPGYSSPIGPGQAESVFKGRVLANTEASREIREIAAAGSNRAKLGGGFKEFNKHAKKIQADTKKISTIVAQNQAQAIMTFGNQQYQQPIGPVRPGPLGRLGIGTGANPRGMFANPRGRAGRISGGMSSALIGGGFPLLFGQGALGAAGGGIGGAIGGALGGPFGFGLSIAGTAIAQRIQEGREFQKEIDKINTQIKAAGGSAIYTADQVRELGKTLNLTKEETVKAIQSFEAFDATLRDSLLVTFGDEETFNLVKGLKTNVQLINDIQEAESKIGRAESDRLINMLKTEGSLKVQKELQKSIMESQKKTLIGKKDEVNIGDVLMSAGGNQAMRYLNWFDRLMGREISQEMLDAEKWTPEDYKDLRVGNLLKDNLDENTAAVKQLDAEFERAMGLKLTNNIAKVRDELEALADPINRITLLSETISSSFEDSFKGIIKGTLSIQEAFRNMFMRIADYYLDMVARMMANQFAIGLLKFFGKGLANSADIWEGKNLDKGMEYWDTDMDVGSRASGGPVSGGKPYIVGEKGPEIFTPGVSGGITPNHALGGSTSISVNIDASGTSVEGSEPNGEELGRLVAAAIQSELIKEKRPGGLLS